MALRLSILGQAAGAAGGGSVWTHAAGTARIGRAGDNDWVLQDPERYISAHHVEVEQREGDWWLRDTSTNGTFVNGSSRPLGKDAAHRIEDGDRIRMGSIEVVAELLEETGRTAAAGFDLDAAVADDSVDVSSLLSVEATGGRPARADAPGQPLPERRQAPRRDPTLETEPGELWPGLVAFCKGAGIDPYALPAQTRHQVLQEAGQAVREMVLGLKELSRSRAEFTREVGITAAGRQRDATSPLLQVSDIEEALIQMLAATGPDAIRAVDEVRSQFARTRHYQQSIVVALREALTAMLERLDPDELERQFGGTTRGPGGTEEQARYWSRYREMHRAVAATDDTGLPAAFVEEFARIFQTLAAVGLRATPKSGDSG